MFATPPQEAANRITSVPAPVGGLNARDSLATMAETDAIALQNWWPQPYGCTIRKGYSVWQRHDLITGAVQTLATWSNIDGQQKLFAWVDVSMYDASVRGTFGSPIVTSLTNSTWQYTNMSNIAGGHLVAVNGVDDGIYYGPGGVARLVLGDGIIVNTWKTLDPKDAIQVALFQNHLWAVKKNSSTGYYLKTADAYYGDFAAFDFGPLFARGGYLSFITNWTIDDGNGAEDHLVAVSSTGTAVVYQGLTPATAATWDLVGVYNVGAPVKGRRSYAKVGGDLFLFTQQGIISMSGMLASTKVNDQKMSFPSDKIQYLISSLISAYGDLSNWQLSYVPKLNMLICNIPSLTPGGTFQLVSNQITTAWAQFTGMDSATWTTFADQPFFGTYDGRICVAWDGYLDNVNVDGTGGTSVVAFVQQAYSYFGSLGSQKQVSMYRPNYVVAENATYITKISYDFITVTLDSLGGPPVGANPYGSYWNEGLWNEATWTGGTKVQRSWIQASGLGVAASLSKSVSASSELLWVSTDYSYILGGLL